MGTALKIPPSEFDHRIGYMDAPVMLVQYGDYECPYCRVTEPVIERLLEEFKNDICYIYRHFPMRNIHPNAELAALSAEAAGLQDKFWEMHRLLFQNNESLSSQNIGLIARKIHLNMDLFLDDFHRPDLLDKVHQDFKGGLRSSVSGTPTFYLNGYRFEEDSSYESLKQGIEELIDMRREAFY